MPRAPARLCRAYLAHCCVRTLLCFTNMYFGLQTGWVTMGSIQCAVVGYAIFQVPIFAPGPNRRRFNALENVVVQTVGVATATMPLAGGFVGIIPALRMLDPPIELSVVEQLLWGAALTYFGIFFAVPLRRQTILVEELAFPSGTATAKLIETLHAKHDKTGGPSGTAEVEVARRWRTLGLSFAASFFLASTGFLFPRLANIDVGALVGLPHLKTWHWTLRPSLSYIGQGMIMRQRPAFSMMGGALIAWAFLGPMARREGWATGPLDSWEDGVQGWLLWVALGLMLAEALTSFGLILLQQLMPLVDRRDSDVLRRPDKLEPAPPPERVPTVWWSSGLVASICLSVAVISPMFGLPLGQMILAVTMSCLIAVLAVRALGQTDLNPVSTVGKLSQLVFAFIAPGHIVANIVAGALAEAGATQAGDLLQDLKTGHLLGASPRAQFFGQLIGATASVFVTVGAFQLYDHAYGVPSAQFTAPVAHVWKDMAILMGKGSSALPESSLDFAAGFAVIGALLPLVEHFDVLRYYVGHLMPSGIAFGVGMYLTPDWTIPRVVGAIVELVWRRRSPLSHQNHMLMVASGFVLGEGVWSIAHLVLKALL